MTTQVIFKLDKKLKEQAMKKAKGQGLSFSDILQMSTRAFVEGRLEARLVQPEEKLNAKTRRELIQISKDIKAGKNLIGPFKTVAEMKKYLMA